jgi:hypothetical protein
MEKYEISDTTSEAEARQQTIFRRMSGLERLQLAMNLSDQMRDITLAGLRNKHPEVTEEKIRKLFYKEVHGIIIRRTENG